MASQPPAEPPQDWQPVPPPLAIPRGPPTLRGRLAVPCSARGYSARGRRQASKASSQAPLTDRGPCKGWQDWETLLSPSATRTLGAAEDGGEEDPALTCVQARACADAVLRAIEPPQARADRDRSEKERHLWRSRFVLGGNLRSAPSAQRPRQRAATGSSSALGTPRAGKTGDEEAVSPVSTGSRHSPTRSAQASDAKKHAPDAKRRDQRTEPPRAEGEAAEGEQKFKVKVEAKRFEVSLSSFEELINSESNPTGLAEAMERFRPVFMGPNFAWDHTSEGAYGNSLSFTFQLVLWYANGDDPDIKTRTTTGVSFSHKSGCAYVYQPVLPVTSLQISPRTTFRPMFHMDPRSFHVFKLAWRHFLDFGVSDFRIIVGEQLERWTQRCRKVIEKPMNATYWLMLMVGSYYRESLVKRKVLMSLALNDAERVPVICVDSFVALSALLFSPERQVLYAGVDPTPSYLKWLQYVADQHSSRKNVRMRRRQGTVFEMNEFLDLSVIIVYYGRVLTKTKIKESSPSAWVGNPALVKIYIAKYAEDNRCECQLEHAVRLYTQTCALGKFRGQRLRGQPDGSRDNQWFCWNGLKVCEVGVPMPCTQATFLSPFIITRPIALMCQVHGPDATRQADEAKKKQSKGSAPISRRNSGAGLEALSGSLGRREEVRRSFSSVSNGETPWDASTICSDDCGSTAHSSEDDSDKRPPTSPAVSTAPSDRFDRFDRVDRLHSRDTLYSTDDEQSMHDGVSCSCLRYIKGSERHPKGQDRHKHSGGPAQKQPEIESALQALGDYDLLHCFAAVLAGGLNLAKMVVRLHFSIDPRAYANLPVAGKATWQDSLYPWYREFHRPDAHGRSRYGMLLDGVLRGLLGDGFTGGMHLEVLDTVRAQVEQKDESPPEPAVDEKPAKLVAAPQQAHHPKKQLAMSLHSSRRPSAVSLMMHGLGEKGGTLELLARSLEEKKPQPPEPPQKSLGEKVQPQPQEQPQAPALLPQEAAHRALSAAQAQMPEPPHRVLGKAMAQLHESLHRSLAQTQLESAHRTLGLMQTQSQVLHDVRERLRHGKTKDEHGLAHAGTRARLEEGSFSAAPAPGLLGVESPSVAQSAARRDKTFKGVISDIILWTELYECESLVSIRGHFESFNQWCHSAHLVPFLQRCYRRFGVAGLVSSVHTGGHKHGMDPNHPLVLPTVAGFCYGHCYPLYRVLQYFYGGVEQLVCSIDDPQVTDAEKAALNLVPGQERLNNQCWFRTLEPETPAPDEAARRSSAAGVHPNLPDGLAARLSLTLEQELKRGSKDKSSSSPHPLDGRSLHYHSETLDLSRLSDTLARGGEFTPRHRARSRSILHPGFGSMPSGKLHSSGIIMKRRSSSRNHSSSKTKKVKHLTRFGLLATDDPFFWFCHQNYMVYTYPAVSIFNMRSHHLDGSSFTYKYSDFASRTGTPEPRSGDADKSRAIGSVKPMPPSLNLCQPTELTSHVRTRWELPKTFVDQEQLILSDDGWFPGALGHRFTFEARTDNVARYVHHSDVPQAQLLYLENFQVPAKAKRKHDDHDPRHRIVRDLFEAAQDSTSSDSGSDQDAGLGPKLLKPKTSRWRNASRRGARAGAPEQGPASLFAEEPVSLMLPPLLPGKPPV